MGGLGWTGGSKLPETDLKRRHPLQAIGRILCSCNMVLHRRTQLYDDKVQTEYVCLQEIPFFGSHKQLSYRIMLTIHESCDADAGPLKGSSWRCSSALISLRTYFNSVRMGIRGENLLCFGERVSWLWTTSSLMGGTMLGLGKTRHTPCGEKTVLARDQWRDLTR